MRSLLLVALVVVVSGCPDNNVCDENMRYEPALGACVCADDAVPEPDRPACRRCADDEVAVSGACVCPLNQQKNANGVCADVPGLGAPCSASAPCDSTEYPTCWEHAGAATCTRTCAADADCPDGYVCADWEATPVCRTFTGYGATCAGNQDCAGFDAAACMQTRCIVAGCSLALDDCPRGTACCDFSTFGVGTLCVPPEFCP